MSSRIGALVFPGDLPPRRSSLKRLLLFFDELNLPHPADRALVNENEIIEDFPSFGKIIWAEQGRFPRSEEYDNSMLELIRETSELQNRGLIRFLASKEAGDPDASLRLAAYAAAITSEELVKAAVPDLKPEVNPTIPDTIFYGFGMAPKGQKSRFHVDVRDPYTLPEMREWSSLGWLRLARSIKYTTKAQWKGLVPISLDSINKNISLALGAKAFQTNITNEQLSNLAISVDAVDTEKLEKELVDLPWREVLKIRKEVLPKVAALRKAVIKSCVSISRSRMESLTDYEGQIIRLRQDLESAKSELANKWHELALGGILKIGGVCTTTAAIVLPSSWLEIMKTVVAGGLVAGAAISGEVNAVVSSYRKVQQHPLLFLDQLPSTISETKKE
jgi:hypothetical protein